MRQLLGWLRRVVAQPIESWHVQFEKGGRAYTYRRTQRDFTRVMRERYLARGTLPHRVQVERGGRLVDVEFDTQELTA